MQEQFNCEPKILIRHHEGKTHCESLREFSRREYRFDGFEFHGPRQYSLNGDVHQTRALSVEKPLPPV